MKALKEMNPMLTFVGLIAGVVVWSFTTFAQIGYVKEQNAAILSIVEQRHIDALRHSDANAERNRAILNEIRDSVKMTEVRVWELNKGKRNGM